MSDLAPVFRSTTDECTSALIHRFACPKANKRAQKHGPVR